MAYAKKTNVPVSRSKAEIERTLERYGATAFVSGWNDHGEAMVGFKMENRNVKFIMPSVERIIYGDVVESEPRRKTKTKQQMEQVERSAWRSMLLLIKAKLEAVESGFTVFDEEFLPHIVTDDGATVYERLRDQIESTAGPLQIPANF